MIPSEITKEHIVKAIEEIDNGRPIPQSRELHRHLMNYNGKTYPPKFTISLANKYANGTELAPGDFYGGDEKMIKCFQSDYSTIQMHDHVWVKKATGLFISLIAKELI